MNPMTSAPAGVDRTAVQAGHADYVFPCIRPYYSEPIVAARGRGTWLTDADGEEYLDFFSGILTTSLGHCHPEVNERVKEQIDTLGHTSTLYLNGPHVEAARGLAGIAPDGLQRTLFTNSGSEAIESAIMAARLFTGRTEIVALRYAYHGRSMLATTLTAHGAWRPLPASASGITHCRAPYVYRGLHGDVEPSAAAEIFAADLEEVILTCTNGAPAAFIAETILGVGGYVVPPPGYFQRAAEIIRRHGGLFICDEVQAGFGRTGKWFGIEHWDVAPDIMVCAKGIANGYPVGATITRPDISEAWRGKTISTFGGNPITMTATAATIEIMEREDVPARAQTRGAQLRAGLDALAERYPWVGEVRGLGLMQAMELVEDRGTRQPAARLAGALLEACRAERLLIGSAGMYNNVVRVAPSLLVSEEEVEEALTRLGRAFATVHASY